MMNGKTYKEYAAFVEVILSGIQNKKRMNIISFSFNSDSDNKLFFKARNIKFCMDTDYKHSSATGYRLDSRGIGVRVPAGGKFFLLSNVTQTGSGAHSVSSPMGTGNSLPGGKVAEA
jgi:hypothetical protein